MHLHYTTVTPNSATLQPKCRALAALPSCPTQVWCLIRPRHGRQWHLIRSHALSSFSRPGPPILPPAVHYPLLSLPMEDDLAQEYPADRLREASAARQYPVTLCNCLLHLEEGTKSCHLGTRRLTLILSFPGSAA